MILLEPHAFDDIPLVKLLSFLAEYNLKLVVDKDKLVIRRNLEETTALPKEALLRIKRDNPKHRYIAQDANGKTFIYVTRPWRSGWE